MIKHLKGSILVQLGALISVEVGMLNDYYYYKEEVCVI